jgi:hypothetical protein
MTSWCTKKLRVVCTALTLFLATPLQAAVWQTTQQWTPQWEQRFSDWVRERFTSDFFTRGEYAGIPQDCADSAYFARLIFSYENGLPFRIRDPSWQGEGSQRGASFTDLIAEHGSTSPYAVVRPFIDNDMTDFDAVPEAQRLRAFIDFVGAVVWTKSLIDDTYPVTIDKHWFRPGVVSVLPRRKLFDSPNPFFDTEGDRETAGHAQLVTDIDDKGVIHYLKSTMPAKVQALRPTTLNSFNPSPDGGSFRYWKQPQDYDRPEQDIPGYGLDQFDMHGSFEDAAQSKLAQHHESHREKIERLTGELCDQLQQRAPVVLDGWRFKLSIGTIHCMTFEEYDKYSTPMRDGKIRQTLHMLQQVGAEFADAPHLAETVSKHCPAIEYQPARSLDAGRAAVALLDGSASSDPNQPPAARWGLQPPYDSGCTLYY